MSARSKFLLFAIGLQLPSILAIPATFTVTSTADTETGGTLRQAIMSANGASGSTIAFNLTLPATITVSSPLPPLSLPTTITGPGITNLTISGVLSGTPTYRGLVSTASGFSVSGLTINQAAATGGAAAAGGAGGGGGGLGGGVYIANGTSATLQNLVISNCQANGGAGGSGTFGGGGFSGGGGGLGGAGGGGTAGGGAGGGGGFWGNGGSGGTVGASGGGGGLFGNGGNGADNGSTSGAGGGGGGSNTPADGGNGGNATAGATGTGGNGGTTGGGGGGVNSGSGTEGTGGGGGAQPGNGGNGGNAGTGTGGGGGGSSGTQASAGGGNGGNGSSFGGGGGGANAGAIGSATAGNGGLFWGGGGGVTNAAPPSTITGGSGGYGGGGGSSQSNSSFSAGGKGGFGGGGGGSSTSGQGGGSVFGGGAGSDLAGGGGAGFGGGIFIDNGSSLTLSGTLSLSGNAVNPGIGGTSMGGGSGAANGMAAGTDVFMQSGSTLTFALTSPTTISGTIASDVLGGGGSGGGINQNGPATLTLSGNNTYTGNTVIASGATLVAANSGSLGASGDSEVTFNGGTLQAGANVTLPQTIFTPSTALIDVPVSTTMTLSGQFSTSGASLTKTDSGTLSLANSSSTIGTITISGGILELGSSSGAGSSNPNVTLGSGGTTFALNSFSQSVGQVVTSDTTGTISTSGSETLTINTTSTLTCNFTGTGGLTVNSCTVNIGNGAAVPAMSFSGPTLVENAGVLVFSQANANPPSFTPNSTITLNDTSQIQSYGFSVPQQVFGINSGSASTQIYTQNLGGGINISGGVTSSTSFAGTFTGDGGPFIISNGSTFSLTNGTNPGTWTPGTGQNLMLDSGGILNLSGNSVTPITDQINNQLITVNNGSITTSSTAGTGFITSPVVIAGPLTLAAVANTGGLEVDNTLSGTGSVTIGTGTGSVIFNIGSASYSGPTTIQTGAKLIGKVPVTDLTIQGTGTYSANSAGTVTLSSLTSSSTTALLQINNPGLIISGSSNTTYAGVISGTTGVLEMAGTGSLTLTNTNTYTQATVLNSGILSISAAANIGSSASLTFGGGTLQTTTNSFTIPQAASLTGSGTFDIASGTTVTLSGNITGTGELIKVSAGTLVLTGTTVSYGGGTLVSAGTLQGSTSTIHGNITDNGTVAFVQASTATYSGNITGTGGVTIDPGASNTFTFSGTNTYSGSTLISSGTLFAGSAGAFSPTSDYTLAATGTPTLNVNNFSDTVGSLSSTNTSAVVSLGTGTLTTGDTLSTTYAGTITGSGGLILQGTGTFTLTNASNSYSGGTTINSGVLSISTAGNLGIPTIPTITFNGGTLQTTASMNLTQNVDLIAAATFDVMPSFILTLSGNITGGGSLTKTDTGTLVLSGTNNYSGGTIVSLGTLQGTTTSLQQNITDNGTVIFSQSSPGTYAGNLSGTGAVTVTATGTTVTFSGTNNYSGGTTLTTGTLIGNTASLPGQGGISDNGTLTFNQNSNGTFTGNITGSGSLVMNGSATLVLVGTNSYGAGTLISSGTLQGDTNSLQGAITDNATLDFNQSFNGTFAGLISGSGGLVKDGTGTVTLTNTSNSYANGTTINSGVLSISAPGDLGGTTQPITFAGGTLQTTAGMTLIQNVHLNAAATFDVMPTFTLTLSGNVTGSGSLTKTDTGTLVLSGINNYGGGTTVSAGTLQGTTSSLQGNITNNSNVLFQTGSGTYASNMNGTGTVTVNSSGNTITFSGTNSYAGLTTIASGTTLVGNTASLPGQGGISDGGTLTFNQTSNGTFTGNISGGGSLVKQGAATLVLSGTNSYSTGTLISTGTLQGDTNSLQGNITDNATLDFNQTSNGTFAGAISGSGGLVKDGTGTVTLTNTNTYSNGTTINSGVLSISAAANLGGTTQPLTFNGGTLQTTASMSLTQNVNLNAAATFDITPTFTLTLSGNVTGGGSLTKMDTGTLFLTGTNNYSGGTFVSGGILQGPTTGLQGPIVNNASVIFSQSSPGTYAGNLSGTGTVTVTATGTTVTFSGTNSYGGGTTLTTGTLQGDTNSLQGNITDNGTLSFNQGFNGTFTGNVNGSGMLVKQGTATLVLSGTNSYIGGTTVSLGTLQGDTNSLQGNITDNATLAFSQTFNGTYTASIVGSGNLVKQGSGTVVLTNMNTYSNGTLISAGTLQGTTTSLQGNITNNATLSFVQSSSGTYTSNITGNSSGSVNIQATGGSSIGFSGTNTYSGATTVSAGTLVAGSASAFAPASDFTLGAGTALDLNGNNQMIGSLSSGSSSATVLLGSNILTTGDSNSTTFAGAIDGTGGSLVLTGSGVFTLTGTNMYSGPTSVSSGTLVVNGLIMSATTTVQTPGTLRGTGTLFGLINNGLVSPGNSIGTLTVMGNFSQASTGTLAIEINAAGQTSLLNVSGNALLAGGVLINLDPGTYPSSATYTFLTTGGTITGTFSTLAFNPTAVNNRVVMGSLVYGANFVEFVFGLGNVVSIPTTTSGTATSVAGMINTIISSGEASSNPDFESIVLEILSLPPAQQSLALIQMSPNMIAGMPLPQEASSVAVRTAITHRLNLEHGIGCAWNKKEDDVGLDVWMDGFDQYMHQGDFRKQTGFNSNNAGFILGTDYQVMDELSVGGAGSYTRSDVRWMDSYGIGHINSFYGSVYSTWHQSYFFIDGIFTAGTNHYDVKRTIDFGTIFRKAKSNHGGYELAGNVTLGATLPFVYPLYYSNPTKYAQTIVQPFFSFDYIYLHENGFKEHGANSMDLTMRRKQDKYLRSEFGFRGAICLNHCYGRMIPEVKLSYVRESRFGGKRYKSFFSAFPGFGFMVTPVHTPQRNLFNPEVGFNFILLNETLNFSLYYEAEVGSNYSQQQGDIHLEYKF